MLPLLLVIIIGYLTGAVVSPRLYLIFCHIVACTRRRTGGCGKSLQISLFLSPLKSTITRSIRAPCKGSSVHRKIDMVLQYCLFHIPHTSMIYARHEWVFPQDDFIPKRYMFAHETRHKGAPTLAGVLCRGMPRHQPERPLYPFPKYVCPNRKCGQGVENRPCVHPPAFVGAKLWNRG